MKNTPAIAAYRAHHKRRPYTKLYWEVANRVGILEAVLVEIIQDWCQNNEEHERTHYFKDDSWWTSATYDEWAKLYPALGKARTVQRLLLSLETRNYVISCQPIKGKSNVKYYRVNEEVIGSFLVQEMEKIAITPKIVNKPEEMLEPTIMPNPNSLTDVSNPSCQILTVIVPKMNSHSAKNEQSTIYKQINKLDQINSPSISPSAVVPENESRGEREKDVAQPLREIPQEITLIESRGSESVATLLGTTHSFTVINDNLKAPLGYQIPEEQEKQVTTNLTVDKQTEDMANKSSQSVKIIVPPSENNSQPKIFDPYFGVRRASPNEHQWDWLPEGPWKTEDTGKLDENFIMAIAARWAGEYGGRAADKKPNVIKHFRNNKTNLSIEWEWYQEKYFQKAANVQVRKVNGFDTAHDEAEIAKHQRFATPLDGSQRVTEVRTPVEIIEELTPYALGAIQNARAIASSGIDENPDSWIIRTADPSERSFWEQRYNQPRNQDASKTDVIVNEGLSKCKSIIDAMKLKKDAVKKTFVEQTQSALSDHLQIMEDMRKRLKSGIKEMQEEAIAWVQDTDNGCELIVESGKVIDIKEIDF